MHIIANYRDKHKTTRETTDMLASRAQYVIMKAQLAGNMTFDGHTQSAEEMKNAEECRHLCGMVERQLNSCKANEIAILLNCYLPLYIAGFRRMPDSNYSDTYKRRVIDAWHRRDRTIEESDVFGLIAHDAAYHTDKTSPEYIRIYRTIKEKWLDTLSKFDRFPEVTTRENYERLALIMRENLDARFGADCARMKRKWYDANKVSDLSSFSTTILHAYRHFVVALYPDVLSYQGMKKHDSEVLKELSKREDIHYHIRKVYKLSLQLETK